MSNKIPEQEQIKLAQLASSLRGKLLIGAEAPIGSDLTSCLDKLHIILIEYPIRREGSGSFSALLFHTKVEDEIITFLGVNSWDYYDRQLFAIAHEIYHYLCEDPPHISRDAEAGTAPFEQNADWFAAELLLPLQTLKSQIIKEFGNLDLNGRPLSTILRFISRLHCTWWLPYKSIVHRLYEADAINSEVYDNLFKIDERDNDGLYYRIGMATSPEVFTLLNKQTKMCGTASSNLEVFLRNYEDEIITEDELFSGLKLFNRSPEDFGISFIDEDDEDAGGADDGC